MHESVSLGNYYKQTVQPSDQQANGRSLGNTSNESNVIEERTFKFDISAYFFFLRYCDLL